MVVFSQELKERKAQDTVLSGELRGTLPEEPCPYLQEKQKPLGAEKDGAIIEDHS